MNCVGSSGGAVRALYFFFIFTRAFRTLIFVVTMRSDI